MSDDKPQYFQEYIDSLPQEEKPSTILLLCGNTCGHNHESINGPTGCCPKHGAYMYYCNECHDKWLASQK